MKTRKTVATLAAVITLLAGAPEALTISGLVYYSENWPGGDDGVATFTAVPAFTAGNLTAWRHNYLPTVDDDVDVPGE